MRVLVNTSPSYGLFFPLVALSWALRLAGHKVLVAAPENMAAAVNGSGLQFVPICEPLDMRIVMRSDRDGRPLRPPIEDDEQMIRFTGHSFGRLSARTVEPLGALIERYKPQVVLAESHAYAAAIAARARDVPLVTHGVGMGYQTSIDEWGEQELAPELARYGLDGIPEPDLFIDPCPPSVRPASPMPAQPMRYVAHDKPGTIPEFVFAKRTRPRVLLTLGTVPARERGPLFAELLRTLPKLGCELVVAAAEDLLAEFPELPDAVVAAGWLPLATVLPACDLAVHHCGGGTAMMALLAGVPQLLVPLLIEQNDAARRLADFGAALRFERHTDLEPAAVLEACQELLDDDSYRSRTRLLGDEIRSMPSPAEVVGVIEDLARQSAARRSKQAPKEMR